MKEGTIPTFFGTWDMGHFKSVLCTSNFMELDLTKEYNCTWDFTKNQKSKSLEGGRGNTPMKGNNKITERIGKQLRQQSKEVKPIYSSKWKYQGKKTKLKTTEIVAA